MFQAVAIQSSPQVVSRDRAAAKPLIGAIQASVAADSRSSARNAARETDLLRRDTRSATRSIAIAFALTLVLLSLLAL
jgi:hypothetical protein